MTILVTGGAGFIGSHLVKSLLASQEHVTIYDSFDPQVHGKKPKHPKAKGLKVVVGDVRNRAKLAKEIKKADTIVHLAAAVGVGQSQYQIQHYVDVNLGGTAALLDVIANESHNVRRIVVAGSMSSYGEGAYDCPKCGRVRPGLRRDEDMVAGRWEQTCPTCGGAVTMRGTAESDRFLSTSIYAVTKAGQEELTLSAGTAYGIPSVALRFFNVYGPGQSLSNPYTGVAAIFMSRLKAHHPPVVYEDGAQSRDFTSVHDIVQAIRLAMTKPVGADRSFNVGTGKPTSILKIAEYLSVLYESKVVPKALGKFRSGDIRHCFADVSRISRTWGYAPRVSLEDGLGELVEWAGSVAAKDTFDKAQAELKKRGLV